MDIRKLFIHSYYLVSISFERTIEVNGRKYRQLVESRWDSEKKQSRIHVVRHLGRVVEREGREVVIPSEMRFDTLDRSFPVGFLAVIWSVAGEFGISDAIASILDGDAAYAILILSINQLLGRRSLTKIGPWVSESPLPRWSRRDGFLTKDSLLSSLDRVSSDDQSLAHAIQNALVEKWKEIAGDDSPAYFFHDITRMRWNGEEAYYAERGYGSTVGRPHIGFGLLVSRKHYFPVAGYPVRGSKPDKTTVPMELDSLGRFGIREATIVWDRGFVTKGNVDYAISKGFHVLSGGTHTSSEVESLISQYRDEEIERSHNLTELSDHAVYHEDSVGSLYGHRSVIAVMLDPERRNRERMERDRMIHALENADSREEIRKLVSELKPIAMPAKGRRGYRIDHDQEDRIRRMDGRSLFFCTRPHIKGEEIVTTYFQKDRVEKAFRYLKGDASIAPVRYQLPGRVEAYLSVVCFISYLIISAILWKMDVSDLEISYEDLVEKTSKIHEVTMTSRGSQIHRWTAIGKELEKLLKPFNITSLET